MNKFIGTGRLTKDPEYKEIGAGAKPVANFTIACDRRFKNRDGQKETDFIPVVLWGTSAHVARDYLVKGSMCGIVGRIQTRNYEAADGTTRYVTEIIADELELMGSPKDKTEEKPRREATALDDQLDADFHLMNEDDDVPW